MEVIKKVKQVIICFEDGSFKGYNQNALKERQKHSTSLNSGST